MARSERTSAFQLRPGERIAVGAGAGKLPVELVDALAASGHRPFVVLIEGEAAGPIRRDGAGFVVETKRAPIRAGRVVLAAASGSKALAAGLGVAIPAEPEPLPVRAC